MKNVVITPSLLSGHLHAVSSKSDAHRILIASALADKKTTVHLNTLCEDINATIDCLKALGADFEIFTDKIIVTPIKSVSRAELNCRESGSTLRFLLPVGAALCSDISFKGSERLFSRPLSPLKEELEKNGCKIEKEMYSLHLKGNLKSGVFSLPGNVSSQFISGLLFALPILDGDSKIIVTSELQSESYVNMTLNTLSKFGIKIEKHNNEYIIKGNQSYSSPEDITVEGDWSNAAFWLCANALGSNIIISGLRLDSLQPDKEIIHILSDMGAYLYFSNGDIILNAPFGLSAKTIDASQIPDIIPILSLTSAYANGTTSIINASRLRIKECDRLSATASIINTLSTTAKAVENNDSLTITGGSIDGGTVDSFNDHRMAMSAAICATRSKNEVTITNATAIKKSYPTFFEDYQKLGGIINVINNG